MEVVTVWILIVQLWTDPPPKIQLIYTKEFKTEEECFKAKEEVSSKYVSMCSQKIKK